MMKMNSIGGILLHKRGGRKNQGKMRQKRSSLLNEKILVDSKFVAIQKKKGTFTFHWLSPVPTPSPAALPLYLWHSQLC